MSQQRLAVMVGETVTQSLVSRWETGVQLPGTIHFAAIVRSLGCSADYLLFGSAAESSARVKRLEDDMSTNGYKNRHG